MNVTCIILYNFFCIEFDTGSSSKEQTFNVELNPPKGPPEVRKFTRLQNSWYFLPRLRKRARAVKGKV